MALDRWLSPILDLARAIVAPERVEPVRRSDIEDAELVAKPEPEPEAEPEPEPEAEPEPEPSFSEPVLSLAMARLLAAQGHVDRARAMVATLLLRSPGDQALRDEATRLQGLSVDDATPRDDEDEDGLAGENQIVAVRANARDVLVSWQVDAARIERGRKLMPDADAIAVRLVVFHRGVGREVLRDERERIVERAGEWLVRDVPADGWLTASVGLRKDARFVSLAHSSAARVP